jgi:hypothetical protein
LENKGFKKESMTKVELDALGKSTTLESNKSHLIKRGTCKDAPDDVTPAVA